MKKKIIVISSIGCFFIHGIKANAIPSVASMTESDLADTKESVSEQMENIPKKDDKQQVKEKQKKDIIKTKPSKARQHELNELKKRKNKMKPEEFEQLLLAAAEWKKNAPILDDTTKKLAEAADSLAKLKEEKASVDKKLVLCEEVISGYGCKDIFNDIDLITMNDLQKKDYNKGFIVVVDHSLNSNTLKHDVIKTLDPSKINKKDIKFTVQV